MFLTQNQQVYNFTTALQNRHLFIFRIHIHLDIWFLQNWSDLEMVGLMAWNTTSSLVRGNIAVDRENFDIAVRNVPGHHGYLKNLEILSRYHRSVDLAGNLSASRRMKRILVAHLLNAPVKLMLEMRLNLLLALVGKAQSFKRIVQVDEPFRDKTGAVLAVGAMLGVRVYKLAVATNEVGR